MKKWFLLLGLSLLLAGLKAQTVSVDSGWQFVRTRLGGIWEVWRDPAPVVYWQKVNLPHCFNASDGVDPDGVYYQGEGWYRNWLKVNEPSDGGRVLLRFDGVGQQATVWVGMEQVGSHVGGYDGFTVDITEAVARFRQDGNRMKKYGGRIPVAVCAGNGRDLERIPSALSDFCLYGGIYRHVWLDYRPAVSLERVMITPIYDLKTKTADITMAFVHRGNMSGRSFTLKAEVTAPDGKTVWKGDVSAFRFDSLRFRLRRPALWSPDAPQLYRCRLVLSDGVTEQETTARFGVRHAEFLPQGPFLLNGERLLLRGTHRHEDHAGMGAAMTDSLIRREMQMMKDMGVNFIRLGHYQQAPLVLELCDSLGFLVWEEIPWCRGGVGGKAYRQQAHDMMEAMISQHYNHPSVILWGLGNENDWAGDAERFDKDSVRMFMTRLNEQAHRLDPTRKTAIRRCEFARDVPDVYSPSIWRGWYSGSYSDYRAASESEMKKVNHFLHVEWGGDSHAGRHSEKVMTQMAAALARPGGLGKIPKVNDWSETYICDLIDWHLKEQEQMPWLTGTAYWPFKDFATPVRPENPVPYVNQKGVTERDLTPKESYYVFQSYWTSRPMARIYGHSWETRWGREGEEKLVKVYSNCPEAELFLNGQSLGCRKRNAADFPAAGLRWNVVFRPGENELRVVAVKGKHRVEDRVTLHYQTEAWGTPARLKLTEERREGDRVTLRVALTDAGGVPCLDGSLRVRFSVAGQGELIDNLGTSGGSRVVELYNGKAFITVRKQGKCVVAVSGKGVESGFAEL